MEAPLDRLTVAAIASLDVPTGRLDVVVTLSVPPNCHIESHEPSEPFLIPTVIAVEDLSDCRFAYPPPTFKDLGLGGPPLSVYQDDVQIVGTCPDPGSVHEVQGTVRYQMCVGGACLPPRTQPWRAAVHGKSTASSA